MISAVGQRWKWWFLLPFLSLRSSSGYFSLKVQSPVSGLLGSSVSLHCALTNNMDVRPMEVHWYRPKMSNTPVLLYKNTQILKSPVDVQYQDRVSLLGELEKGDVSLKLENLRLADRGEYVCHVTSENWYDKATVSLSVRVVGSVPVLSSHVAEGGKVNVSCQSHGWLPEPSITWTDDGKDLKHLSKDKFTNNSEGLVDVSSWLIESEWVSCAVGLSDQEIKESRIMTHTPTESWNVSFTVTLILLLLCISGSAACLVRYRNVLMDFRRTRTSGSPSERKLLDGNCVKNEDKSEGPAADTDHHTVDGESTPLSSSLIGRNNTPQTAAVIKPKALNQVKEFKVNITIDPDETPTFLSYERNEVKCTLLEVDWDRDTKIFTLCTDRFKGGHHYWEVKVRESRNKVSWFIGVASEAAERKFHIPFTPQNELWVLCYETETGFYIRDRSQLISLPDINNELTAVGVFLDCDEHTLSFYNVDKQSHIYTFTNVEPKSSLCPLISPGVRDNCPIWIL